MAATEGVVPQEPNTAPAANRARGAWQSQAGAVLAAALALPGVLPGSLGAVQAEEAPEQAQLSLKYLGYQDSQPGLSRIRVRSPSAYLLMPLGSRWSIEGSVVGDTVSGASPRYHTAISGASVMHDERHAVDLKVSRHEERSGWSLGLATSDEHDYHSRSLSAEYRLASEDNNRTWNVGLGLSRDRIGSTNDPTLNARKRVTELQLGVTQALTKLDLVQATLTYSRGRGYYNDPYKDPDVRPGTKRQTIAMLRWNHHFEPVGGTLRTSYRWYQDSWKIRAHTLEAEWVQPVSARITISPLLRVYSQSAASFYYDPVYDSELGAPYPPGYFTNPPAYASADQRLSAFGARTFGLKLAAQLTRDWSADIKLEHYRQQGNWRLFGTGSTGLAPFSARFVQVGLNYRF